MFTEPIMSLTWIDNTFAVTLEKVEMSLQKEHNMSISHWLHCILLLQDVTRHITYASTSHRIIFFKKKIWSSLISLLFINARVWFNKLFGEEKLYWFEESTTISLDVF